MCTVKSVSHDSKCTYSIFLIDLLRCCQQNTVCSNFSASLYTNEPSATLQFIKAEKQIYWKGLLSPLLVAGKTVIFKYTEDF